MTLSRVDFMGVIMVDVPNYDVGDKVIMIRYGGGVAGCLPPLAHSLHVGH